MKFYRYRRPSLSTALGITKMKKRTNKALGITAVMKPFRAQKNFERKLKRSIGYYSEPVKAIRHATTKTSQTTRKNSPHAATVKANVVTHDKGQAVASKKALGQRRGCLIGCRNTITAIFVLMILMALGQLAGGPSRVTPTSPAISALVQSATDINTSSSLSTSTQPEITNTQVNRSSSGFVTITPAPGTTYPTATITDTLAPTFTATLPPAPTNSPTSTPTSSVIRVSGVKYYSTRTANVRSCARSQCEKLGQLTTGTSVTVVGIVSDGEAVQGSNATWYQIEYGGTEGFVYSAYLTDTAPAQAQQAIAVQQQAAPQAPTSDPSNGATALCNDGTYSYAAHHQGACSHHGGVAVFYR